MITTFDIAKLADAYAIAGPKHVWIDGERVVVYTDADIPVAPPPEPVMIEEAIAIKALKNAGVATDEAAKTMLEDFKK